MPITIGDVLAGRTESQAKNCLYVVCDGTTRVYVGKTAQRTLNQRLLAHLGQGPKFMALSPLGAYIEANRPASNRWSVEILTLDTWKAIFDAAGLPRRYKLNTAESALIRLYRPLLNRTSHPDHISPLPWTKKVT